MSRRLLFLAPAAALLVALASVDLPLFMLGPGPAREVRPLIDVDGAATYEPDGKMLLTTVGYQPATVFEAAWGWIAPDYQVVTEDQVIPPDLTEREYERYSLVDMRASQIAATAVALGRVTDYPEMSDPGFLVQDVVPGSPADGELSPGDVLLEVNGEEFAETEVQPLRRREPAPTSSLPCSGEIGDGR